MKYREIANKGTEITNAAIEALPQRLSVDGAGRLWVSFVVPVTYVYEADGEKVRTVQFRGAGVVAPSSLSFTSRGRLLITPGCYEFAPG